MTTIIKKDIPIWNEGDLGVCNVCEKGFVIVEKKKLDELVAKCNKLEKEKMAQDDTIDELIEDRNELSSKALQLEKKLEIATNALESMEILISTREAQTLAKDALEQIQEVK